MRFPSLYAIADASFGDPVQIAAALFSGGARLVQIRNKAGSARELLAQVEAVMKFAPEGAQVIVNDRVDVARIAGAAGVHVGQGDLPPEAARRVLLPGQLLGYSTHSLEQALAAEGATVDYIAVGPVFSTTTKRDADPVVGLEGLRRICSQVTKPVVAIGGMTLETRESVQSCGVSSIAVISDILKCSDRRERVQQWLR